MYRRLARTAFFIQAALLHFPELTASSKLFGTASSFISAMPPPPSKKTGNIQPSALDRDSAALRELKDVIQQQRLEIDRLKKQQGLQVTGGGGGSTAPATQQHHHHHGAPASSSPAKEYMDKTFASIALERVGWLSVFLVSLSLTALIMNGFEHTLASQIELAYFVPLLAGHGGNTGGQTVGTVLSALSSGAVQLQDAPQVIWKEAMSGMTVGLVLGTAVGSMAHFVMGISAHVAIVVCCTLPIVSMIASTLGSSIPFGCIAMGMDPSVIAAPAMTSLVDVMGLMSYFLLAQQIFQMFGLEL